MKIQDCSSEKIEAAEISKALKSTLISQDRAHSQDPNEKKASADLNRGGGIPHSGKRMSD